MLEGLSLKKEPAMIVIEYENGCYYPLTICDQCDEPIHEVGLAMVRHSKIEDGDNGARASVYHVHKGACDKRFEADSSVDLDSGWSELDTHLFQLLRNTGVSKDVLERLTFEDEQLGQI